MKYRSFGSLLVLIFCMSVISAQNYTENRSVTKRFKVSPGVTLDINNKYGKVEISTWNKDSVKIEASLSINTTSASKIMKLRNSIDFDFSATTHYIIAKTVFKSSGNSIVDELKTLAESIVSTNSGIKIDYMVTTPKNINLRLTNKYGDVYADDLEGDIQIIISNGGLKAGNLIGNVTVDLSFGNGYIDKIDKGRLVLSYADVSLKSAERLTIESKSSKVTIDNAQSLKLQTRRDKLNLGTVSFIAGDSYFSDVRVTNLIEELNLNARFGTISIETIRRGFSFVNVSSEYTDVDLFFERSNTFLFDITYNKEALIRMPKEARAEDKISTADPTQKILQGHLGSAESTSKVKVLVAKKASVNLFIK